MFVSFVILKNMNIKTTFCPLLKVKVVVLSYSDSGITQILFLHISQEGDLFFGSFHF